MPTALAIAAHPDDIEFVMAGTLALLKDRGYDIHYMNVADGCCGSTVTDAATTARIRRDEAREACHLLGATFHESLTHDLEIFYDRATLVRLSSIVREVEPRIVLTHAPVDYMEDHTNTCRLAVTAAFSRGMPNFPVEPCRAAVTTPVAVYHAQPHGNRAPLGDVVRPSRFVDVGAKMDLKTRLLEAHASQRRWLDESQGLGSYVQAMRELMREVGAMSREYEFAEGWRRHLHLGLCAADDDPLAEALADCSTSGAR